MHYLSDFFAHIDKYLYILANTHPEYVYIFMFSWFFIETSIVLTSFLPGGSIIFIMSTIAAANHNVNVLLLGLVVFVAACLGDSVNFKIGKSIENKLLRRYYRLIDKDKMAKARSYFDTHGLSTILIGKYMPFVRSFAPFIAGMVKMQYKTFVKASFVANILWVWLYVLVGYFFGTRQIVRNHFGTTITIFAVLSVLPAVFKFIRRKLSGRYASTKA